MEGSAKPPVLFHVDSLKKYFSLSGTFASRRANTFVRAVDGVSFDVAAHETMSLVGESGCGKSTTGRLVLRLEKPTAGRILFRDKDIQTLKAIALREYHAAVQAVFQDPWSSLDPRMRVREIIAEPLEASSRVSALQIKDRVVELMAAVGLDPAVGRDFPHEFSGGQRQRIAIARALAPNPSLIVLDEPVSSLDVSIAAQVMNLLKEMQHRFGSAYLLIAHNLATVRYLSDRVAVMYMGQIVEMTAAEDLFIRQLHPYTQALLSAALPTRPSQQQRTEIVLSGELPSPTNPPSGCRFRTRCRFAFRRCAEETPLLQEAAPGHQVACHLY